jgi:hypothetical protein
MRKSYGFRTFHVTETALYHTLGKFPEPDVAHKFFWRSNFRNLLEHQWISLWLPDRVGVSHSRLCRRLPVSTTIHHFASSKNI